MLISTEIFIRKEKSEQMKKVLQIETLGLRLHLFFTLHMFICK